MGDDQQTQESNQLWSQNQYYNNISALQIRLDTTKTVDDFKMYLSGEIIEQSVDEQGNVRTTKISMGKPKANKIGVQSIMSLITMLINTQVVQGNFTDDRYENYIEEAHKSILDHIIENMYLWGIDEHDLNHIIDTMMLIIQAYVSRLIDNKEREGYQNTIRSIESSSLREKSGGGFNIFGKK